MRFRLDFLVVFLLCSLAYHSYAGEGQPESRTENPLLITVKSDREAPAVIEADSLVGKKENKIEATGNVILRKNDQSIRADRLLYSQDTQNLDAQGSVVLEQKGGTISGPHLQINLDTNLGTMEQPVFYFSENNGRGTADILHIQDKQHYILDKTTYTTCPAGNQDWLLKMDGLEIDRDRQIGTAHHTWVEFMGVPILYSPWMDFPLNNQRKSGFLSPSFGSTSRGGSELTIPYYWNIAANADATIAPRMMLKRGLMFNDEFRYLEPNYNGEAHVDVLPNDALEGRSRDHFALKHNQALTSNLSGYVDFNRVSDDDYFRDLGNAVNTTSQINLLQESGVNYNVGWWTAAARIQRYQTLQDPAAPIVVPYTRLPQLTLKGQQNLSGANVAFASEYVSFTHPTAVNGSRLVINPSVSYPLVSNSAFYVTPKVALHGTYYEIGTNNVAGLPNASRILPMLSVDSGIALEREGNLFGSDYIQTLEPRAFYVYVPYRDQTLLPNFDSAQADFTLTNIFTENRFFGSDRIGDANQITLAGTSRWLEKNGGAERFQLTLGERFSFETPRVNLVGPTASTSKSNILLAASGQVTKAFSLDSELQVDPNQSQTQLYNVAAHYRPEPGKVLNWGYRFTRGTIGALIPGGVPATPAGYTTINGITYPTIGGVPYTVIGGVPYTVDTAGLRQMDVSGQWPLSNHWHAVGRLNYSFPDSRVLDSIAGLEYNQSCWTLRLVAQHFTTALQQTNTGFFVQLELNDLVKVGSDPLSLLKQSVSGYTKLNDKPANKPE